MTLVLALAAPAAAQSASPAKVTASIARLFGAGVRIDTVMVEQAPVLRMRRGEALLGFARIRTVKGKDQPITLLIAVDTEARLQDVDVLVYREPYGGEVAYESWRKQFRGKHGGDPLVVGRDIRGISGATISVNAVTLGVRGTLDDFARWHTAGVLE